MNSVVMPAQAQPGQEGHLLRAAAHGLVICERCGLFARMPQTPATTQAVFTREDTPDDTVAAPVCPCCLSLIHMCRPDSLACFWTLLTAAAAMYLPANLLSVMTIDILFGSQQGIIMSGIVYLWTSGSWHLVIIVLIVSFLVPLAKLGIPMMLCLSAQQRWCWNPRLCMRLHALAKITGRWSMLDAFVVTPLVGLVHLSTLAITKPGPGVDPSVAVVVLTMLAARCFDPHRIRDVIDELDPEETNI